MPATEPPDKLSPDKLSIVVQAGEFDRVHYALVMASGAAAVGRPVTLFFTMGACRALARPGVDGRPPWRDLPLGCGPVAGIADDGGGLDDHFARNRVATFEELLAACAELGVRFLVCEMGLKAMGMTRDDLRDDLPLADGGVVTFLGDASRDGAMLVF